MTSEYKPSSIAAIVIGIGIFVVILIFFAVLPDAVKVAGSPFLFLPTRLGIISSISPADIQTVDLATAPTVVRLGRSGAWAIYTADPDLLQLDVSASKPWLTLTSQVGDQQIPTEIVQRGLRPYDTPLVKGRPVLRLTIDTPGLYSVPRLSVGPPNIISIVPDPIFGHEGLVAFLMSLQLAVLLGTPAYILGKRRFLSWRTHKSIQRARRREVDSFWDRISSRTKH